MKITFSEGSGLNDSVYGKCQAPIRMFLEQRGEQFEQQSVLKNLFLMGTSENYGDLLTTMTAMSGFEPVGENGAYPADGMQEGFSKLIVYDTWKDSFKISAEMIEDAKLMDLRKQPAAFMTSYNRTREMFGAALFGNAMKAQASMQYKGKQFDLTTADGVTLFNTAHPPKVSGENQCNLFSDAFSVDALGQMETAMHLFRGDNDEILDVARTPPDPGSGQPEKGGVRGHRRRQGADHIQQRLQLPVRPLDGDHLVLPEPVHHGEHAALGAAGQQVQPDLRRRRVERPRETGSALHRGREHGRQCVAGPQPVQRSLQRLALCRRGRRVQRTGTAGLSERNN